MQPNCSMYKWKKKRVTNKDGAKNNNLRLTTASRTTMTKIILPSPHHNSVWAKI